MTISILLCDDLAEARDTMARLLRNWARRSSLKPNLRLETAESGEEMLFRWKPKRWDIIFLDIYMPGMTGIEAGRILRQKDQDCSIVMATTSWDYGMESFELRASDYLTKPFSQETVDAAMDWVVQERWDRLQELTIRTEWEDISIRVCDIHYIEIRDHICTIHTENQSFETRRSMDDIAAELLGGGQHFLRCHRSYLINMNYINDLEKQDFIMAGGDLVPVSTQNLALVKKKYMDWQVKKGW